MYGYIYKTTNLVNGKIYIGQKKSKTFLNNKYLGSGKYLWCAINKYGIENFKVELIDCAYSKQDLDKLEVFYINKYNSTNSAIGYNIALGAVGGDTYSNLSESDKKARDKKLSSSLKSSYIKKVCINKDDVDLRIKETDLQKYLDEGWNKGRSKKFQDTLNKSHIGIKQSDEWIKHRIDGIWKNRTEAEILITRQKHSEATKNQMKNTPREERINRAKNANKFKGHQCVWVNKDCKSKFIYKSELQTYLDKGYSKGMYISEDRRNKMSESAKKAPKPKGFVYVYLGDICKRIDKSELDMYLNDGWKKGNLFLRGVKHNGKQEK